MSVDLLVVGASGGTNVGESLYVAASEIGVAASLVDVKAAWAGSSLVRRFCWHFLGHRPPRLGRFGEHLVSRAKELRPRWVLAVGIAPLNVRTVRALRAQGIRVLNFLTDDPWNPAQHAPWALRALREMDCVISPRRGNMADLQRLGCRQVRYVPFGYDLRHAFREAPDPALASDVLFVGGADADRAPWIAALFEAGLNVGLYGDYWDRFPATRRPPPGRALLRSVRTRR